MGRSLTSGHAKELRRKREDWEELGESSETKSRDAVLTRLGFASGMVVQELGYDEDADDDVRFAIEDVIAADLEDEDYGGTVDAVLMWWRHGDGDLVDAFVDAQTNLVERGFVVLLTPKAGRFGHVEASDVQEAASVAGLNLVGTTKLAPEWTATRVIATHGARK